MIGTSVHLDSRPFTVVGIVADRFAFPDDVDAWVPLVWTPGERAVRSNHSYAVIGRLKRGVDIRQAQAEMTTISERLERQYPEDNKGWGAIARTLHEDLVGDVRPALLVLLGAVALVALIACANVANLLLAKTLARSKEIALRTALGATRRRLVRQLLTESVMLGLGGAALGALVGHVGLAVILATIGERLPRVHEIGLDRTVLAFTCLLGVLTSIGAAAVPAWRLTHGHAIDPLKQREGTHAGQRRLRNVLVVSEVALAMMLLVGAGLLLRTLWNLQAVDPGFEPRGVLTMSVSLSPNRYPTPETRARFYDASLDRLRALPGVEAAAGTDALPLEGGSTQPVAVEGQSPVPLSDQPQVQVRRVSIDYRRTLRMRLAAGRDFSDTDTAESTGMSRSSANRWRGGSGRTPIRSAAMSRSDCSTAGREIVGVVNDVKYLGLDVRDSVPSVYLPIAQVPSRAMSYVIRAPGGPERIARAVERVIHEVDPEQPVLDVMTLDTVVGRSFQSQRFAMMLLTTFAGLALLLAAVGIYSVLSYSVTQRVPEIGIQMALGAPIVSVIRQVVMEGLTPTLIGLGAGIAGASVLAGALNTLLFGVSVRDVSTIGAVSLLVIVVTVFATLVPARRATLVDPMVALRAEYGSVVDGTQDFRLTDLSPDFRLSFFRSAIEQAYELIRPHVRVTPVLALDRAVTLKLELMQHAGSFKTRGAFTHLLRRKVPPAGVIAASGGNHGAAVAYAASRIGVRAEIFVPSVSSPAKIARIRGYGAELVIAGERYADALAASERRAAESGALTVHAYDQVQRRCSARGRSGWNWCGRHEIDTFSLRSAAAG